jgi:hypothetical protein
MCRGPPPPPPTHPHTHTHTHTHTHQLQAPLPPQSVTGPQIPSSWHSTVLYRLVFLLFNLLFVCVCCFFISKVYRYIISFFVCTFSTGISLCPQQCVRDRCSVSLGESLHGERIERRGEKGVHATLATLQPWKSPSKALHTKLTSARVCIIQNACPTHVRVARLSINSRTYVCLDRLSPHFCFHTSTICI